MPLSPGQLGATNLLAQLLASIEDPHDEGVSVSTIREVEGTEGQGGVAAEIEVPGGDRYLVVVQWQGDRESA